MLSALACAEQSNFSTVVSELAGLLHFANSARGLQTHSAPSEQAPLLQTFLPATERLIAIGDLHGDIDKARRAFRLAGLIDDNDRWSGGTTTAVQVTLLSCPGPTLLSPAAWPGH